MKKIFTIQFLLFVILISSSFSCFTQDKISIKFEAVDIHESCYILSSLVDTPQFERVKGEPYLEEEIAIDSESAYKEFQKKISAARNMSCASVSFPAIDFSQKILLAKWMSGDCTTKGFNKNVLRDDIKKEIIYSVQAIESHQPNTLYMKCLPVGSLNLIAIPKFPKDYKIVFIPASSDKRGYQSYSCVNGKMIAKDWNGKIVELRNTPPPAPGGIFGVQMDCGDDSVHLQRMSMDEKKRMIMSGFANIPPPCPEGTYLQGKYCVKKSN